MTINRNSKQITTHVNEIEDFEEIEPQHDSEYDPDQEDLIEMDPSETFEKKLIIPFQYNELEGLGGFDKIKQPLESVNMFDEFDVNECIENATNPKIIENATNPKIIKNETTT